MRFEAPGASEGPVSHSVAVRSLLVRVVMCLSLSWWPRGQSHHELRV